MAAGSLHDLRRVAAPPVPDLPPPARAPPADGPNVLNQGHRAPRAAARSRRTPPHQTQTPPELGRPSRVRRTRPAVGCQNSATASAVTCSPRLPRQGITEHLRVALRLRLHARSTETACWPLPSLPVARCGLIRAPIGGPDVRRPGARPAPCQSDRVRSIAIDCCSDGHRHQVSVEVASRELARDGRVMARCGHLVIAAALADVPRPACPLCYPSRSDI
jgi:hypothetical protein